MKTTITQVTFIICAYVCLAGQGGAGQQSESVGKMASATNQQLSVLAIDLIEAYTPPSITNKPGIFHSATLPKPPELSKTHLEQKYRAAWEELLLASVTKPIDRRVMRIRDRIIQVFWRMPQPESVPILAEAFSRTSERYMQEGIITALRFIHTTNSLENIFIALDSIDVAQSNKTVTAIEDKYSLRAMTFNRLLPSNAQDSKNEAREGGQCWLDIISNYPQERLSKKNQEFIERAKTLKRPGNEK